MRWWMWIFIPGLAWAQDFPFQQEIDSIPVTIGTWQPFCPWNFGMYTTTPGFGDLDGDGDLDLLIGEWSGHLNYFENLGTFQAADYAFLTQNFDSLVISSNYEWYNDPRLVDIDTDNDLDLFWGNGGRIFFYRNNGTTQQQAFALEDSLFSYSQDIQNCDLADLDTDGDLDIFCGGWEGRILYARNDGSAQQFNFTIISEQFDNIDVGYWSHPALCDLDADGDYDLFIGNDNGNIWYYRNDGTPQEYLFTYVSNYFAAIAVGEMAAPEFCDIDGDEDYDLFVGREPTYSQQHMGDVFFYENIGTPEIPEFECVTSNYLTADVGTDARQQLIDIDADVDLDLFVGASDEIRFFRNTGTPTVPAFTLEEEYYQNIHLESIQPFFCDIDADSDLDIFAGEGVIPGPPGLHLYLNTGTPQQAQFSLYSSNFVTGNFTVLITPTLADIDADGDLDLFLTDQGNGVDIWYYENVGSQNWPDFQFTTSSWQSIDIYSALQRYLRFWDMDEDGDLDLFFYNNWNEPGSSNLRCYRNDGTPQNPNMNLVTSTYLPLSVDIAVSDFCDIDSDGRDDLFVGEMNGGILFFHGVDTSSVPPLPRTAPYRGPVLEVGPNPANPVTTFSFELRVASSVNLEVYDVSGRRVAELLSGRQEAGAHVVTWDASGLGSGVYLARLQVGGESQAGKVVVVK